MSTFDEVTSRSLRWAVVGELSARVGHETNNLLAGIMGQAELGLLSQDPVRMTAALETILKGSREMRSLTERLMGFARLLEPREQAIQVGEIVRTLFSLVERSFVKSGVQVTTQFASTPVTWCDPGAVVPALLCGLRLPLDSLRAVGGGTLNVGLCEESGWIRVAVSAEPPEGALLPTAAPRRGDLTLEQAMTVAAQDGVEVEAELTPERWRFTCSVPVRSASSIVVPASAREPKTVTEPVR